MKILTGGQFRELDIYTIEHEPIASYDLMERASRAISNEILRRWPDAGRRIVVFAGPGGNGGDGLAVARMLSQAERQVCAFLFNVKGALNADCESNRNRLMAETAVTFTEVTTELVFPELHPDDIVIDALFGTGLSKPLSGGFAHVTKRINQSKATIVSIDVPSGLMCEDNSYNDLRLVVQASVTLSIGQPKLAFFFAENQRCVGDFCCLPIGLSREGLDNIKSDLWITEDEEIRAMLHPRPRFAHKGTMGHALLVVGSRGMMGAAILAAKAALRSGCGKVTVHIPHACLDILQSSVPEAVVQMDVDDSVVTSAIDTNAFQAVGIGPGLGQQRQTAVALRSYITHETSPMVIDADAINLLSSNPEWLHDLPANSILTPHPRELDHLVGHCSNAFERMNRARRLAIEHHLFVVVKGHYSQICTPSGDVLFNPTGNAGMATAGSGDVLTGIITSLLAQGYIPADAVRLGVYLHGLAGDLAADALSEESLIASDIIDYLPAAFKVLRTGEITQR